MEKLRPIRVHQHGANARRGADGANASGLAELRAVYLGRSRGGLTTRIHAVTDARGLPITLKLTTGQAHDGVCAYDMLKRSGRARPCWRTQPTTATGCAERLAGIGSTAVIRPIPRRTTSPHPDRAAYRRRNRIERFFEKLKLYRAIATRYEKHDANFLALVKLAATRIWLRRD